MKIVERFSEEAIKKFKDRLNKNKTIASPKKAGFKSDLLVSLNIATTNNPGSILGVRIRR